MYYIGGEYYLVMVYKTQEEALAGRNNVGVEYDLVNDFGFNLCVMLQSLVMR